MIYRFYDILNSASIDMRIDTSFVVHVLNISHDRHT